MRSKTIKNHLKMKTISIKILFAIILLAMGLRAQAANVITMVTSKSVGDTISLNITAFGSYTVSGADSVGVNSYKLTSQTVTITGNVVLLDCNNNSLTALDVSHNAKLRGLYCNDNSLTSLDLNNNTELVELECYNNSIGNTQMDKLVTSLVNRNGKDAGWLTVINTAGDNNEISVAQAVVAKAKNWKVLSSDGKDLLKLITMVTSKSVGDTISLNITAFGSYTVSGADSVGVNSYKLTSQTVFITGDVVLLDCNNNSLTALDVSHNAKLRGLYCNDNSLTSLDLSYNTELVELDCNNNSIGNTQMDKLVTSLVNRNGKDAGWLTVINTAGDNNEISVAQVNAAKAKNWNVYSSDGKNYAGNTITMVTSLPVGSNIKLDLYSTSSYTISGADATAVSNTYKTTSSTITIVGDIIRLACNGLSLTSLDVRKDKMLTTLYCQVNSLAALDVSQNTSLSELYCDNNRLTKLDLSADTALYRLDCFGNSISYLQMDTLINSLVDRTGKTAGTFRVVSSGTDNNEISSAQVNIARAKNWNAKTNEGKAYEGTVSKITMVTSTPAGGTIWLRFKSTGSYTLSGATGTYSAGGSSYKLTSDTVIISGFITSLDCDGNSLTALDVSKDLKLSYLDCGNNSLNTLDVSHNVNLDTLFCFDNTFTTLDVSQNTNLAYLDCRDNSLDSLDCSGMEALRRLTCSSCKLTSLKATDDANLAKLECDHNSLTALDLSRDTSLVLVDCRNNSIRDALMDTLVNTLVNRTGKAAGMFVVIDTDGDNNVCTATQVDVARAKNWNVKSADGNDYGGSPRTGIEGITGDPNVTVVGIYDLRGIRLARLQPGFNIIKLSNGTAKKVFIKE
jgi:Leucine-rich repeat (LRR) protein